MYICNIYSSKLLNSGNLAVLYQYTLHASAIPVVCTVSTLDFGCPGENLHLGIDLVVGTEAGRGQTQD